MASTVLVINAGSGTLKSAVFTFEAEPRLLNRRVTTGDVARRAKDLLADHDADGRDGTLAAIGHRIVHGGPAYHEPTRVTARISRGSREDCPVRSQPSAVRD